MMMAVELVAGIRRREIKTGRGWGKIDKRASSDLR